MGDQWGVYAADGAAPLVEGNMISGQTKTGVAVEDAGTAPILRGNDITGGEWGLWVEGGANPAIEDDTITDAETGIEIEAAGGLVRGDHISGGKSGISLREGATATIEGNELSGHATGVTISDAGTAPVIAGNDVVANAVGIEVHGGATPTIEGNTISDNSDAGISVEGLGTSPTIEGNTLRGNGTDLDVSIWTAPTLIDNDLEPIPLATPRPLDEVAPEVMARVEELRGLQAKTDVPIRHVDQQQAVVEHMAELEDEDIEELRAEEALLKRVGLLPREMDLLATLESYVESEVAGYYRPEYGDIAIVDDDGLVQQEGEWVLAHEYVHALQDQHFDIEATREAARDGDESTAVGALLEGDATWLGVVLTVGDAMSDGPSPAEQAGYPVDETMLDTAPLLLRRELLFPYLDGLGFVSGSGAVETGPAWMMSGWTCRPPRSRSCIRGSTPMSSPSRSSSRMSQSC